MLTINQIRYLSDAFVKEASKNSFQAKELAVSASFDTTHSPVSLCISAYPTTNLQNKLALVAVISVRNSYAVVNKTNLEDECSWPPL